MASEPSLDLVLFMCRIIVEDHIDRFVYWYLESDTFEETDGLGALATGTDILIAEALHKSGAEFQITLPYPVDRFCELLVAPYGGQWIPRFKALVEAATRLEVLTELPDVEERLLAVAVELADLVAIGQCVRNAGVLKSRL